jgi:hypothetical protein
MPRRGQFSRAVDTMHRLRLCAAVQVVVGWLAWVVWPVSPASPFALAAQLVAGCLGGLADASASPWCGSSVGGGSARPGVGWPGVTAFAFVRRLGWW